jgi:hypothetical protein
MLKPSNKPAFSFFSSIPPSIVVGYSDLVVKQEELGKAECVARQKGVLDWEISNSSRRWEWEGL